MGKLYYGSSDVPVEIPDDLLAHVKVVTAAKLRRGESFTATWRHAENEAGGRSTIWLQPSIPLRFVFDSPDPENLRPGLLRELAQAANSAGGMTLDLSSSAQVVVAA